MTVDVWRGFSRICMVLSAALLAWLYFSWTKTPLGAELFTPGPETCGWAEVHPSGGYWTRESCLNDPGRMKIMGWLLLAVLWWLGTMVLFAACSAAAWVTSGFIKPPVKQE